METQASEKNWVIQEVAGVYSKQSNVFTNSDNKLIDCPEKAFNFIKEYVLDSPRFTPGQENLIVLFLDTRRNIIGFQVVFVGTMNTLITHPREIFRAAILHGACFIVIAHNHPSGNPEPSEADIKITRDLIRAGQLLKIDLTDHVIFGDDSYRSLRELGYFYNL